MFRRLFGIFLFVLVPSFLVNAQIFERGFGYSGIAVISHSGTDVNNDIYGDKSKITLVGEKRTSSEFAIGNINNPVIPENVGQAYLAVGCDMNGDGMDDLVTAYRSGIDYGKYGYSGKIADGVLDQTYISVTDGSTGETLFCLATPNSSLGSNQTYKLASGDFDGDGDYEFATVSRAFEDVDNDGFLDGSSVEIYDLYGELTYTFDLDTESGSGEVYQLEIMDYNGDQCDDILICQYAGDDRNHDGVRDYSKMTILDIINSKEINIPLQNDCFVTEFKSGFFTNDNLEDVVLNIRYLTVDINGIESYVNKLELYNPAENVTMDINIENGRELNSELPPAKNLNSVDLNLDGIDELVYSMNYESGILIFVINPTDNSIMLKHKYSMLTDKNFDGCSAIYIDNFNSDSSPDILVCYSALEDLDGNGVNDGTILEIFNNENKTIYSGNPSEFLSGNITPEDGVLSVGTADINGDGSAEICLLHRAGDDVNADGLKDNTLLGIIDINNRRTLYSSTSQLVRDAQFIICPLKNEFSDKELLRGINFNKMLDSPLCRDEFFRRKYRRAFEYLFDYYLESNLPEYWDNDELYETNQLGDFLVERLRQFSTASGMEDNCYKCDANWLGNPSSIMIRLKRLLSTFRYRIRNANDNDFDDFRWLLKSLVSHANWFRYYSNITRENNHAILFELNNYIYTTGHLWAFKLADSDKKNNWCALADERINEQFEHVLQDGIYDEHSIGYAFLYAYNLNGINKFYNQNNSYISYNTPTLSKLNKKVQVIYKYLLYAVKPISVTSGRTHCNYRSDIPLSGDSDYPIVGKWKGKLDSLNRGASILSDPLVEGYSQYWNDKKLINNLIFASLLDTSISGSVPEETSMAFPESGFFVSRSNWNVPGQSKLDHDARYMHYKGGEIIPTGGNYNGYTTNSKHGHADLLSIEVAGYNKNMLVDPAGYINSSFTEIIDSFNSDYYHNLIPGITPSSKFNMVRSYFKETATHNTVVVNNAGQLRYQSDYNWWDLGTIEKLPFTYIIEDEFDIIENGYIKERYGLEHQHNRKVVYIKPNIDGSVSNDYWIIIDNIYWEQQSVNNSADQCWHISPEQNRKILELEDGLFKADNFYVAQVKNEDITISSKMLNSYVFFDTKLEESKIIKYSQSGKMKDHYTFITIIFPFPENDEPDVFEYENVVVTNLNGEPYDSEECVALKISHSYKDKSSFDDYCLISSVLDDSFFFYCENGITGTLNAFEFKRYSNSKMIKELSAPDLISTGEQQQIDLSYDLKQNYPNPFNNKTSIQFNLAETGLVKLKIYNVLGQEVRTITNAYMEKGNHRLYWDGINDQGEHVASGIYIYNLEAGGMQLSKKMTYLK